VKIAFIGGGVMAEAMVRGILNKELTTPSAIGVSDISEVRRKALSSSYGVNTFTSNLEAISGAEVVVLAIKPQDLTKVLAELSGHIHAEQLVLSIIAGASLDSLCQGLNHGCLVRAMPNMPAQVSCGISVWTATSEVSREQREKAGSILDALGKEVYVAEEKYIDMATAVSGSGPAYVFVVIESLIEAAVHIGLPRDLAQELVTETVLGSAQTIKILNEHPARLRDKVTSPGGTTAAGLLELEKGGLRAILTQAVIAAYEKAKVLRG